MPEIKSCLLSMCLCRCFDPVKDERQALQKTPVSAALSNKPHNTAEENHSSAVDIKTKDVPRYSISLLGTSLFCGPLEVATAPKRVLFVQYSAPPRSGGLGESPMAVVTRQPTASPSAAGVAGNDNPGFVHHI